MVVTPPPPPQKEITFFVFTRHLGNADLFKATTHFFPLSAQIECPPVPWQKKILAWVCP